MAFIDLITQAIDEKNSLESQVVQLTAVINDINNGESASLSVKTKSGRADVVDLSSGAKTTIANFLTGIRTAKQSELDEYINAAEQIRIIINSLGD